MMKIFFHNDFFQVYASEPAAEPGRLEPSYNLLLVLFLQEYGETEKPRKTLRERLYNLDPD